MESISGSLPIGDRQCINMNLEKRDERHDRNDIPGAFDRGAAKDPIAPLPRSQDQEGNDEHLHDERSDHADGGEAGYNEGYARYA
jgi:hypothetical protein